MTFHWAFNKLEYRGLSNFPTDGAIILAPNHCNTLMDALAVLSINNDPKVFVARADIFKKPRLAKFLRFIKILPISRIRDGKEALLNNGDTIEESISAICDGVP
ncbi:MAG: 1-acyl-sn-glycerol-3-phosphate acyltransferase, partial [Bacteroidales bacterium]|nr:1-acyl-sn-glycerol-3-phosphate acyltransferase [Bacteroidales bacterium]